jgi:tetratricopeptide (TPR) repeat protein
VAVILVAAAVAALAWAIGTGGNGGDRNLSAESDQAPAFAEAVELYRRGRDLWKTRSAADLHQATLLLEQAVEKDPNFAPAYAALADAYAFDTGNWKKVQATANRAIELDPSIGEPLASIGFTKFFWEWRTAEAESYFRKSLMLSPDYATAHQWYAVFLASDGQFNQALAEINRALELEPEALAARADLCQILYFLQRYDDAEIECRRVLAADDRFFSAHLYLYDIYTAQQRYDEAVNEFFTTERLAVNHSTLPQHLDQLKTAYDNGGIHAFWRLRIKTLDKPPGSGGFTVGKYYARLGENEKAMAALRRASEKPNFDFPFVLAEPVFRNCCLNDPKYRELLELWASRKNEDPPDLIR